MTKSEIARKNALFPTAFDNIFENFRRDMEDVLSVPKWPFLGSGNRLVSDFETRLLYATWKIWATNMKLL